MNENLQSLVEKLKALSIPAPEERVLQAIADAETIEYLHEAADAATKGSEKGKSYLQGIFFAVCKSTKDRLTKQGFTQLPIRAMLMIGKEQGPEFAKRLRDWDMSGLTESDDARYVRLTIAGTLQKLRSNDHQGGGQHSGNQREHARQPQNNSNHGGNHGGDREQTGSHDEQGNVVQMRNRQNESATDSAQGEPNDSERDYKSVHIYGGKAAVCFSLDKTRGGTHTIRIEGAEANGQRQYDWKNKVSIQLSSRELPLVLCVLMQWNSKFEGKGHGANNEKWFSLENQGGKFYLSCSAKTSKGISNRGVPIPPGDAYSVTTLFIRQMLRNDEFLTAETLMVLVRKQAELMNGAQQGNGQRSAA